MKYYAYLLLLVFVSSLSAKSMFDVMEQKKAEQEARQKEAVSSPVKLMPDKPDNTDEQKKSVVKEPERLSDEAKNNPEKEENNEEDEEEFLKKGNILILDDASSDNSSRWQVLGPGTKHFGVYYINNDPTRKKVIQLKGFGLKNVFIFRDLNGNLFNLTKYKTLQWKMKFEEPFVFQVLVSTSEGKKYLVYSDIIKKTNTLDEYLHIGLGSQYMDGKWHTVTRNIEADLRMFFPNIKLKAIHAIFFRGSGFLDDIWALKKAPKDIIVEDGENYGLEGWDILGGSGNIYVDNDPHLGATIFFDSGENNVAYRLRKPGGSYWKIKTNVVIQWKMKMKGDFKFYVIGDSSEGNYLISYDNSNTSSLYDEKSGMIHHGLGQDLTDGQWHVVTRDLSEDLKTARPGVDVYAVSSIILRGHGWIDDVRLLAEQPSNSSIAYGWDIFDDDPPGSKILTVNDQEKGMVVELSGDSIRNGYRYSGKNGSLDSLNKSFIEWSYNFSQSFDFLVLVETPSAARYIHYVPMPEDYIKKENDDLYIGIGKTNTDGRWHTGIRNLKKDIKLLDPGLEYVSVRYFLVRGSGRIGAVKFSDTRPETESKLTPSVIASVVLGQFDFAHNLRNLWDVKKCPANSLNLPLYVSVERDGHIYVADTDNGRVLVWSFIPKKNGTGPLFYFGDKDLKKPAGITYSKDFVVVSDTVANSLFFFKKPLKFDSKPSFVINKFFKSPKGIYFDGQRLLVADTGNNRVLVWNSMPLNSKTSPDLIIGQSSMNSVEPNQGKEGPTYNTLKAPSDVYCDGISVYIADTGNNRVTYYKKVPTMSGWHADYVIGQNDGYTNLKNMGKNLPDANTLNQPSGVFAYNNKLFVSDTMNNRVLVYLGETGENGRAADGVIGQVTFDSDFVNRTTIPGADTLFLPEKVFVHKDIVFVADTSNNRILIY